MKAIHFIFPALTYFLVSLTSFFGKDKPDTLMVSMHWFFGNYLILVIPYLVWFIIQLALKLKNTTVHAGFFGAHLALIITYGIIFSSASHEAGNGWFLYYPIAFLTILLVAFFGFSIEKLVDKFSR